MKEETIKVLITGFPRSGTTLLPNYLNSHEECVFMRDSFTALFRESLQLGITSFNKVLSEKEKNIILFTLKAEMVLFGKRNISHLQITQFTTLNELFNLAMNLLIDDTTRVFGVKVTAAGSWLKTLIEETDMKIIYLVRDLRDVLLSSANAFARYNRYYSAQKWARGITEALAINSPQLIIVRFEDLILDTEKELERLSAFLGVKLDSNIKKIKDTSGVAWGANPSFHDVQKLFDPISVFRWKKHLTSINVIFGSIMFKKLTKRLGYEENPIQFLKGMRLRIISYWQVKKIIFHNMLLFVIGRKIVREAKKGLRKIRVKKDVFKKTILFVTPYRYSGLPQYVAILKNLEDKNIETIYLDYNYPNDIELNLGELKHAFHKNYQLRNAKTKGSTRITNRSIFNNVRNARMFRKQILNFLDTKKPAAVISLSDLSIGDRIIFSWCKRKNVPFIILQSSVVEAKIESYKELSVKRLLRYVLFNVFLSSPLYSRQNLYANEARKSHLLLWSKYLLLDRTRERVYIIGNPAFDKLFRNFSPKTKISNKAVICTECIRVFGRDIHEEIMKIYVAGVKAFPNLDFIIKVHPKESEKEYLETFNRNDFPNVKVIKDINLYKLFEECDIQVSVNSTSTLEAAAMGVPTITVAPESIYQKITDLFKGKINIRARNSLEFISAIDRARGINHRKEFLLNRKEYFDKIMYSTDGSSGKRALGTIFEIIQRNKKTRRNFWSVIRNE